MFQQIEEQQKAVQEKLAGHILETSSGEGLVTVRMAGNKEVRSIIIDREHPGYADADQVEDHLVLALNDAIRQASTLEQELVQEWMSSVLPGGLGALGGLGSLFGK
ncbi:MAG: YbaB/EbfC family nucleoid-associated protein [Saprospiraceae bacterium]|nr:YbaB/EbfC family nucleoid-associated protein [Saprospiraceae bacterium]